MTIPKIGEMWEHRSTGGLFEVKKINQNWLILFSRDGSSQIMIGKSSFDRFFGRVPPVNPPGGNGPTDFMGFDCY